MNTVTLQATPLMRKTKRSFSLVEVILCLIFIGIALSPLLQDQSIRVKKYTELSQKLYAERLCEETLSSEITKLIMTNEYTFPSVLNGYNRKEPIGQGLFATITLSPIEIPEGLSSDNPQYCLSKLTVIISSEFMQNKETSLATRSIDLLLQERKGA